MSLSSAHLNTLMEDRANELLINLAPYIKRFDSQLIAADATRPSPELHILFPNKIEAVVIFSDPTLQALEQNPNADTLTYELQIFDTHPAIPQDVTAKYAKAAGALTKLDFCDTAGTLAHLGEINPDILGTRPTLLQRTAQSLNPFNKFISLG